LVSAFTGAPRARVVINVCAGAPRARVLIRVSAARRAHACELDEWGDIARTFTLFAGHSHFIAHAFA
jgi:hypothetical protein